MSVMGVTEDLQFSVLSIVAGILHLGNINFIEQNNYAAVADDECEYMLGSWDHLSNRLSVWGLLIALYGIRLWSVLINVMTCCLAAPSH